MSSGSHSGCRRGGSLGDHTRLLPQAALPSPRRDPRLHPDQCGIVNPDIACRCTRRAGTAVRLGRIDPSSPTFVGHPTLPAPAPIAAAVAKMEDLHDAVALFRSHPDFAAPDHVTHAVTRRAGGLGVTVLVTRSVPH